MLRWLLLPVLVLAWRGGALARDAGYDLLGKVLTPFVGLFAEKGKGERAVSMQLRVEELQGFPAEFQGAAADLALQMPDHLRISAPFFGQRITLCRQGRTVWVYPGSVVKAVLESPEVASKLPPPNREFKMGPFRLPIPSKQLVFLPALFQVRSAPDATIDGAVCQGINLQVMPEIASSLKLPDWNGALWVDPEARPLRFALSHAETRLVLRIDKLAFARTLPPETWAPTGAEAGDVMIVPPARYDQILRAMLGERAENAR